MRSNTMMETTTVMKTNTIPAKVPASMSTANMTTRTGTMRAMAMNISTVMAMKANTVMTMAMGANTVMMMAMEANTTIKITTGVMAMAVGREVLYVSYNRYLS